MSTLSCLTMRVMVRMWFSSSLRESASTWIEPWVDCRPAATSSLILKACSSSTASVPSWLLWGPSETSRLNQEVNRSTESQHFRESLLLILVNEDENNDKIIQADIFFHRGHWGTQSSWIFLQYNSMSRSSSQNEMTCVGFHTLRSFFRPDRSLSSRPCAHAVSPCLTLLGIND